MNFKVYFRAVAKLVTGCEMFRRIKLERVTNKRSAVSLKQIFGRNETVRLWIKAVCFMTFATAASFATAESWEVDGPFANIRGVQFTDAEGMQGRHASLSVYCQFGAPAMFFSFDSKEEIDGPVFFTFLGHDSTENERIVLRELDAEADEDWYRGVSPLYDDVVKGVLMKLSDSTLHRLSHKRRLFIHWSDINTTLEGALRFDLDNASAAILTIQAENHC